MTAHAEDYAQRWARLANEHLAMVKEEPGKSYERELFAVHNTFWRDVSKKCKSRAVEAGIEKFSALAVLDAEGAVVEFLTMPESQGLRCYVEQMSGRRYPRPPTAPFYELITVRTK
ncbi:MAG: hypothetical protein AMXMBFR59_37200 [Rhodanobacteraceae bacterium]